MGAPDQKTWLGWRMMLPLAGAMLLPLTIYALVTLGLAYRDDRQATERATVARAGQVAEAVGARLSVAAATMRALGTIRSIRERNWVEAAQRSREIEALDPYWRNVALIDTATGSSVFDLREPGKKRAAAIDLSELRALAVASRGRPQFSGIVRRPAGPEVDGYLAVSPSYLLKVSIDPLAFQRILLRSAPPDSVSAIVDRRGLFIARTRAWPERLGTPATVYVRRAIAQRPGGLYRSVTWEGFESYTAFATVPGDGWSAHVAVSSALIDRPQYGWRLASILAALASVALSSLLMFLIVRLIAARRLTDAREQQAQRLEAVGQLTGGVAHDFNNMLAIVIGSLDLARRRLASGNADVMRYIDNAEDGASRAADLTRRLLAFSRRQPLAPALIDVNKLIEGTRELLDRTLAGDIDVELDLAPDAWPTFADPGQLENALVNLAVNARDAMPDGGTLTISTANQPSGAPGRSHMVGVTIADTGSGMPPEVAARAFEPFFTTKDVGRGTGLGLSQIHGFAQQSGGDVKIHSQVGRGTDVTILLPRHRAAPGDFATPHRLRQDQTAPAGRPEEIILVVEDEEQVRRTNVEALRSLGYTVRHAANAEAALKLLETQPGVRLLLSDIVMPGMNGRDLAERVQRSHPPMKILLVTGFERDGGDGDEQRILRKPFGIGELARRVRAELDQAA